MKKRRVDQPAAHVLDACIETQRPHEAATAELIAAARAEYQNDDVEIDDDAVTSRSDHGTWVQAWVYVSDDMLAEHNKEQNDDAGTQNQLDNEQG